MINLDFLTLKAFFLDNIDYLIGARVQKIQQPTRKDLLLNLRNNGESRKLYINISPDIYHIAFISESNEKRRGLTIPKQPPMFCMLLRKYIEGCKILDACVVENERIFEMHFESCNEFGDKRCLCLCVELMGKHSNIILYDKENSIIIGCAHNVGAEKSRYRELQGGLKYIYPPKNNSISNELKSQFKGLSQADINKYLTTEIFTPAIIEDRYTLFKELLPNSVPQKDVNEMVDNYYAKHQEHIILNNTKSKFHTITSSKIKKVKSSINKIELLLKKRDNIEKYKLYGELLTANLYQKKNYSESIEVFDYINNTNIIIDLDNTKTLNENAQRYFKLYAKAKKTKEKSSELLEDLKMELEYLETISYSITSAKEISELEDLSSELGLKETENKTKNKTIIKEIDINGFKVYIGRNNKQNDYIISKLAKDEDLWFHTRLCAGSHVLLKVIDKTPDEKTIYECCKIARENSSATLPSKVGVIYTKRKYIKKPPKAPLGYVTYKNEKELLI